MLLSFYLNVNLWEENHFAAEIGPHACARAWALLPALAAASCGRAALRAPDHGALLCLLLLAYNSHHFS